MSLNEEHEIYLEHKVLNGGWTTHWESWVGRQGGDNDDDDDDDDDDDADDDYDGNDGDDIPVSGGSVTASPPRLQRKSVVVVLSSQKREVTFVDQKHLPMASSKKRYTSE